MNGATIILYNHGQLLFVGKIMVNFHCYLAFSMVIRWYLDIITTRMFLP